MALAVLSVVMLSQACPDLAKVSLAQSVGRCMDGTPPVFYWKQGTQSDSFVIHLQSGGECHTEADCHKRSVGKWGTSKDYPQCFSYQHGAPITQNATINPDFANFTRVYVPYCSGDFHLGTAAPSAASSRRTFAASAQRSSRNSSTRAC